MPSFCTEGGGILTARLDFDKGAERGKTCIVAPVCHNHVPAHLEGDVMLRSLALVITASILFGPRAVAADPAAATPAVKDDGSSIGEVRIQTFPAVRYIAGSADTTFDKMMDVINKFLPLISKGVDDGTITPGGPCIFVYRGMTEDMSKPFKLEIGWIVSDKTKDQGELKVQKTEPFKCASVIITGPVANIPRAYEKVMPAIGAAKLTPTGENHELYLFWEGPDSPNNIVQLQVGVK